MKALILIGGMGTRLRPFTCNTPKPMLPIANKPFLYYQIELIKKFGIKEVIFCVSYLNEYFKRHFGSGKRLGIKISYTEEKIPLGTGGAVKNAQQYIDDTTVIFNGDILTDIHLGNLLKYHKTKKSKLTIALVRVKDPTHYGLVETDNNGKITKFLEKPSWDDVTCNTVNSGTYVFEPELLDLIPKGHNYSLERGLFPQARELDLAMFGYAYSGYWLDIGSTEKYMQAQFDVINGKTIFGVDVKKKLGIKACGSVKLGGNLTVNGNVLVGAKTKIDDWVQLGGTVSIGSSCTIKKGAILENCVILNNTTIEEGVKLNGCIIGSQCKIGANAVIDNGAAIGDGTHITKFSKI